MKEKNKKLIEIKKADEFGYYFKIENKLYLYPVADKVNKE